MRWIIPQAATTLGSRSYFAYHDDSSLIRSAFRSDMVDFAFDVSRIVAGNNADAIRVPLAGRLQAIQQVFDDQAVIVRLAHAMAPHLDVGALYRRVGLTANTR